jgi:hypothetical protein
VLESPPPPDNGVPGSGADRANRVGVYMGIAPGSTVPTVRRRQAYLAVDGTTWVAERRWTADAISTANAAAPVVNGFIGAPSGSPGSITSADGTKYVNGDGTASWPGIEPVGRISMYLAANLSVPSSTATTVPWDVTDAASIGVSWSALNKEFTVLTAGTYLLDLSAFFVFSAATVVGYCWINVTPSGGTTITRSRGQGYSSNTLLSLRATDQLYLAAGSKVSCVVQQNGVGNQPLAGGATRETAFKMVRVSA